MKFLYSLARIGYNGKYPKNYIIVLQRFKQTLLLLFCYRCMYILKISSIKKAKRNACMVLIIRSQSVDSILIETHHCEPYTLVPGNTITIIYCLLQFKIIHVNLHLITIPFECVSLLKQNSLLLCTS